MNGGNFNSAPVTFWRAGGRGGGTAVLPRPCRRIRSDDAKGRYRPAARTVRTEAATQGMTREVVAGSTLGRWPNHALQRIAAR